MIIEKPVLTVATKDVASIASGADYLATALTPQTTSGNGTLYRIQVSASVAVTFGYTRNGGTMQKFHSGTALTALAVYIFDLLIDQTSTYNFQHTGNTATIDMVVQEILVQ